MKNVLSSSATVMETKTKNEWGHIRIVGMERDRPAPLDPLVLHLISIMGYNSPTENIHTTNLFQKVIISTKESS